MNRAMNDLWMEIRDDESAMMGRRLKKDKAHGCKKYFAVSVKHYGKHLGEVF